MRYLVTGGGGFLGAVICQQLLAGGDEAVAYDMLPGNVLPMVVGEERAREMTVRGDITDPLHLLRTAKERRVGAIIHMAALLGVAVNADPALGVRVNAGGFVNMLETARILGLKRVVYASSISVVRGYGPGEPVPNDAPYRPINIYGGTKILDEILATHYTSAYGLETTGFRFSFMIGVARRYRASDAFTALLGGGRPLVRASAVPDLWQTILRELIDKPSRGEAGRVPCGDDVIGWLAVEDAARAVVLAARAPGMTPARAYNIRGDLRPIREAVATVRALLPGATLELAPGRHGLQEDVDASALEADLGFKISWRMEDQIKALLDEARAGRMSAPKRW